MSCAAFHVWLNQSTLGDTMNEKNKAAFQLVSDALESENDRTLHKYIEFVKQIQQGTRLHIALVTEGIDDQIISTIEARIVSLGSVHRVTHEEFQKRRADDLDFKSNKRRRTLMTEADDNIHFMTKLMEKRPSGGDDNDTRSFIDNLASAHKDVTKSAAARALKEDL